MDSSVISILPAVDIDKNINSLESKAEDILGKTS